MKKAVNALYFLPENLKIFIKIRRMSGEIFEMTDVWRDFPNDHFPEIWRGRQGPIIMPIRSPDFTLLDFIIFGDKWASWCTMKKSNLETISLKK